VALQVGSRKAVLIAAEDKEEGMLRFLRIDPLAGCEVETNLLRGILTPSGHMQGAEEK
jgi:hypothetical protein